MLFILCLILGVIAGTSAFLAWESGVRGWWVWALTSVVLIGVYVSAFL